MNARLRTLQAQRQVGELRQHQVASETVRGGGTLPRHVAANRQLRGLSEFTHPTRIGKRNALVAVARSILVIVWHLLADPTARFHELGADYHTSRIDKGRRTRNLVHQLEALGHKVTLQPAAEQPVAWPFTSHEPRRDDPAPLRSAGCCRLPDSGGHFPVSCGVALRALLRPHSGHRAA
jgi:hypothetical protein